MSSPPVFVVGVPRSGTTLLASMLSAHSRMACGPETAYFASLAAAGRPLPGEWPGDLISFAESTRLEGESLLDRFSVGGDELTALLADRVPSPVGVLEALGELTARRAGKARWIEKSPIHLLYARDIRRWFPDAPIVRIVRDPRDVALSLTRVPWGADDLLGGLLYWRRFHERSRVFFASDALTYTIRYEELVADPESVLRRVCSFLGEEPEPEAMLGGGRVTGGLVREGEAWKGNVGGPIDSTRAGRWRELPEADRRLADAVAGDLLQELDYPLDGAALDNGWLWLEPRHEAAAADSELRRSLGEGRRLWPRPASEPPAAGLVVGDPDGDDWLGRESGERLRAALAIVRRALGLRLRGKRVAWRSKPGAPSNRGLSSRLLSICLAPLTVREAAER